jgi:hypothetical protein
MKELRAYHFIRILSVYHQEPFIWEHATGVPPAKASPKYLEITIRWLKAYVLGVTVHIMNHSTYKFLSKDEGVTGVSFYSYFECIPPITSTEGEISKLQALGYDYATDGHSETFTIIYSEKETASLAEIEAILKQSRTNLLSAS